MDLAEQLEQMLSACTDLEEYVKTFREFCKIQLSDEDVCFLEVGNFDFSGSDELYFSLVCQLDSPTGAEPEQPLA